MLTRLQLIRNVGQFDSVASAAALTPLCLLYAENGRGKTTITGILRSLGTGDPIPVLERRRLAAQHPPHVIVECSGGPPPAMFQNGTWNRTLPEVVVFDDSFVDQRSTRSASIPGPPSGGIILARWHGAKCSFNRRFTREQLQRSLYEKSKRA